MKNAQRRVAAVAFAACLIAALAGMGAQADERMSDDALRNYEGGDTLYLDAECNEDSDPCFEFEECDLVEVGEIRFCLERHPNECRGDCYTAYYSPPESCLEEANAVGEWNWRGVAEWDEELEEWECSGGCPDKHLPGRQCGYETCDHCSRA